MITEKPMEIIVACEESQEVTKAFRAKGHNAYSCDILDCSGGYPEWHIKGDVLDILNDGWDMMIAFPPCTRLANSGIRWLKVPPKGKTLKQIWEELVIAVAFYKEFQEVDIELKAIENPVMHPYAIERIGKIKRQIVQPWWFGDKAFKATGFELFGLPELTPTDKLIPPKKGTEEHKKWSFIHRMPPGPNRAKLRSKTFPGIANAMSEQWV